MVFLYPPVNRQTALAVLSKPKAVYLENDATCLMLLQELMKVEVKTCKHGDALVTNLQESNITRKIC